MSGKLLCDGPLADALRKAGLDSVEGAFAYGPGQDLVKPGLGSRRRTRIRIQDADGTGHVLYLKRYEAGGATAAIEAENILAMRKLKIPTMDVVAWGVEDATGRSFLVVTAVPGDAMERCFEAYLDTADPAALDRLTRDLADLAARLHAAGFAHRDFYASHVFMNVQGPDVELYLIDLARVFRPRWRKRRWWVKDLAQLKYSMPDRWIDAHWEGFLERYVQRKAVLAAACFAAAVDRKAAAIASRQKRKASGQDR